MTKPIGEREGTGTVEMRVLVPSDAQHGEYTVPVQVDAEAVGSRLTTGGWITFTIIKPTPAIGTDIQTAMTLLLASLLFILVAYAYLKR